ncbi:MAG: hypothetical protein ACP5SD_05830 [Elusimicrobiales bacterium]
MKSAYINLYDKSEVLEISKTLISNGYEIYSQGSTLEFLIKNEIAASELKSQDSHPNIELINIISGKKKSVITKPDIIIADIPESYEDFYNTMLIVFAIKKGITVITDNKSIVKSESNMRLFGEISQDLKKELLVITLNKLSYIFSKKSYEIFPYINIQSEIINIPLKKEKELKYGENPHQKCAIYSSPIKSNFHFKNIKSLDYELNLNHYLDVEKALNIFKEVKEPTIISLKHSNICSLATAESLKKAVLKLAESEHGNTYAFNEPINSEIIKEIANLKPRCLIAPDFSADILKYLGKKNEEIKIISFSMNIINPPLEKEIIHIGGDFVIQEPDIFDEILDIKSIAKRYSIENTRDIKLAYILSKHLKTHCAVIVSDGTMLSYSQGDESSHFAILSSIFKMNKKNMIKFKKDMVLAIDGFLDINSMKEIIKLPIKTVIHGSIETNNELNKIAADNNISLLVTAKRHLKHIL